MHLWEIHPGLVHFPIALLTCGVALDLFAWRRARPDLTASATSLLVAGVATGWLAGLAGLVAFFTVPAHTARAHDLMLVHLGMNVVALALFSGLVAGRIRERAEPSGTLRLIGALTLAGTLVASYIGGWIVYHGGAGVDPAILSPELVHSHAHAHGQAEPSEGTRP